MSTEASQYVERLEALEPVRVDEKLAPAQSISSLSHDKTTTPGGQNSRTSSQTGFKTTAVRYLRNTQRYVWDDPDKPSKEKRFLFKLDVFLLTSSCLGYFCRALDQQNINNAYISGMKEALNMQGSELTYASNVFTAGYVIGQIPAVILVTRLRPSILVPSTEVVWAVLTFCSAAVMNVPQLYAIRFLIGFFEGAYFPVMVYLIGSWYTKEERGKRITLFYASATLAGMFSGYLQAGVYNNLAGRLGHAGWQWLFIVCGIISIVVAFLGFFLYPDFPETTRAFYLTKEEAKYASERLRKYGYQPLGAAAWDRKKILRIAKQWQLYVLPLGYFFVQSSFPAVQPAYSLWLKSTGHSVYEANVWPTGQAAVGVVVQVAAAMISDSPILKGRRLEAIAAMQFLTFFSCIVIAIWNIPDGLKYVAYYLSYSCSGIPGLYYAWYPDLIPHDHEMRGFVIAASNIFSYINIIWWSSALWGTINAPMFRNGYTGAAVASTCLVLWCALIRYLQIRDEKKRELEQGTAVDEESPDMVETSL